MSAGVPRSRRSLRSTGTTKQDGPDGRFDTSLNAKAFVMVGICGGYTTFSAFSLQTLALMQEGAWLRAGAYIVSSVVLCLIAVWAGHVIAQIVNMAE